ncbi:MAG TPA: transketolase, partial [Clostridiales bacterium]|nr:transketolase [Clostridiales bacterium]
RDRFVLSAGHASMLLYSLLYLFGYGLTADDLKSFRQWGSRTPGHPEYGHTPGVETTTGPLGQGLATAVGMAMAQAHLGARFNRPGFPVFDHYTYALAGDGCMMEGISSEAASLAGTLGLGRLIVFYDDNDISIEGNTDCAFLEDVGRRHEAYGWQVLRVADGNDRPAIAAAITAARADLDHPSLIIFRTQIAYGSPLAGQAKAHGEPLGAENLARTKEALNWPCQEPFQVPAELLAYLAGQQRVLQQIQDGWQAMFAQYRTAWPDLAAELDRCLNQDLPDLLNDQEFWSFEGAQATRSTSGVCLNRLAARLPNLIGGSADLAPSTKTVLNGKGWFCANDYTGSNIHFGVREFAMAAAVNGMALYGGLRPFCATFFVFTDYFKAAVRLSAIMKLPVIYVLTHDSIGVGEDGPTHEPIEQLATLRATPGVTVFRPADGKETAAGYLLALQRQSPTCLILSRQNLPTYPETGKAALQGGYILRDAASPDIILLASGSEVELVMKAADVLSSSGVACRVVSMPSMEVFNEQPAAYRESVLPARIRTRLAVEAGSTQPWYRYVGLDGQVVGIDHYGASAPAKVLFEKFGLTVDSVVTRAHEVLNR